MNEQKRHLPRYMVISIVLVIIVLLALFSSDYIGTKVYGIYYLADNTGRKYNLEIIPDLCAYSIQIDLDNLESNKGKVLYQQNGMKIVIEKAYTELLSGKKGKQYIVQFRSIPNCSSTNGVFISFHARNYDCSDPTPFPVSHAKCKVKYSGKEYDALIVSSDEADQLIGCALFSSKAIQDGVLENPHGKLTFTVTNLFMYNWTKRQML